jgi:hypothetical protein
VAEREVVVTAVPLWLLRDYLVDAGGVAEGERRVRGDGWVAELSDTPDHVVGSLRVGRVRLVLAGDDDAVATVWAALEPRLIRAGG